MDLRGNIVSADVQGSIMCQSHLSGVPDLLLTFNDPCLIDDCSFHPCVRYARFENEGVLSFVPPDGNFELMRYRIDAQKVRTLFPPVYCNAQWSCDKPAGGATEPSASQTGRLALNVGVTSLSSLIFSPLARKSGAAQVEDFSVSIPFPKGTKSATDFRVNMGTVLYDEVSKVARWNVAANMVASQKATLACKFIVSSVSKVTTISADLSEISERRRRICARYRRRNHRNWLASPPNLSLGWKIPLASVSGIAVSGLSVVGETYKPYKGVRNVTQAGIFQVRCSS